MTSVARTAGRKLKELREAAGLKQKALAERLGIVQNHLYRIEAGHRNPTFEILEKAARIFGVPVSIFLEQDAPQPSLPPNAYPVGPMVRVPIVGVIRAGEPILAEERIEGYCSVAADEVTGGEHFFLRVRGDSMIGARIQEGDLVLVRRQADVDDGDIAVVMVNDDEATIKRVYREDGKWLLKPENPTMRPLVVDRHDVRIIGKVIQLRVQLG